MIKINMEMPKSCTKCRFHLIYRDRGIYCLASMEAYGDGNAKRRSFFCPLQEVKE